MATTIEEVLALLDAIIDRAITEDDSVGYFAYVYRRTTEAVRQAVLAGRFEDNERMIEFDVSFANLYLDAYNRYRCEEDYPLSWQLAFNAAGQRKAILQHVMLGMNAHINLDLGVAAGRLMVGQPLAALARDFGIVNDILREIIEELQQRISRVSPLFAIVDHWGRKRDEKILDFSMRAARTQAWTVARKVWEKNGSDAEVFDRIDKNVYRFGQRLARPKSFIERSSWKMIAVAESKSVGRNIEKLRS